MSETVEGRMSVAAVKLAAGNDVLEALVRGLPVPREQLRADALQAIGEPAIGDDLVLSEELALRLVLWQPNGTEPEEGGEAHSWKPLSLRDAGREAAPRPTLGGLVYTGLRHVFAGEPESLKTWAAAVLVVEAVAEQSVVYIDAENGPSEMRERFLALGMSKDNLDRIHYIEPTEPMTDPAVLADVQQLLADVQPALVVVDSFDALLELHGLDPNSTTEVGRFYRKVVGPLRATGAAIVLLDHVGKDKQTRGRWAIGSQRKVGVAEVALGFELVQPFGRGRTGLARVVTHKDRRGWLPRPRAAELELRSDEATGAVTGTWKPATAGSEGDGFRPTRLMEKVSRYVEAHVAEEKVTFSAVETVTGKAEYVRSAAELLIQEGYLEETAGPRGARLLTSIRPFRETGDEGA